MACVLGACATTPDPRPSGVPYLRAVGNEPGWTVTVYPDSLVYVTNYGEDRHVLTHFVTRPVSAGAYQSVHPDPPFEMVVSTEPCYDGMSGELFERTVTVRFDDRLYPGCADPL